ncbi:hypothetical protein H311_00103, partial [Anncaliia algerae PRA109]
MFLKKYLFYFLLIFQNCLQFSRPNYLNKYFCKIMVDLQNTNTIINLAWLSFYTPKKITKKLFKVINIPTVIKTIKENTFRLPVVSKLMTGVVNMYYYKCKIIYDEFVTLSALPQPKKAKLVKTYPINKITLSEVKDKIPMQQSEVIIENKENDLSNVMIDVPSFVMEPSVDMSYSMEIGENFNEIDSKVISHSIEQLRDDTLVKRRKIIIDDDLNEKEKRQRIKIIKKNETELPLVSKLFNEYLTNRIVKEVNESSIEIERANSVIEPVF